MRNPFKRKEKILNPARLIADGDESASSFADTRYADYLHISPPAYRAITLRASAVASARPVVGKLVDKKPTEFPEPKPMSRPTDAKPDDTKAMPQKPADKEFVPVENHPIQELLDRVNNSYSSSDLWFTTEQDLCIYGTSYWLLDKNEIWVLDPDRMEVVPGYDARGLYAQVVRYDYLNHDQKVVRLRPEEIIRFRQINPLSDMVGLSPIAPVRLSLDMGHDALMFNRNFFKNSATPSDVAITYPGVLTDEEVEAFYKRWDERFRGANNAHRPILLSGQGTDAKRIGLSQRDMEFKTALSWAVEDAARVFGVPPPLLYSQEASIYNNVSEANRDFWRSTVMARWKFLESALNEQLLPRLKGEGLEIRFDFKDVLPIQESLADINAEDRLDVSSDIQTINEVRERRGMAPVPWGDGPGAMAAETAEFDNPAPFKLYRPPRYDRAIIARGMANKLERAEKAFNAVQSGLFSQQRADIERKLAEGMPASMVFSRKAWEETFARRGEPMYQKVYMAAAKDLLNQHPNMKGIPKVPSFIPTAAAVKSWVEQRVKLWASSVNEETGRLLSNEIAEANLQGESISEIQRRVEKVFNFNDIVRSERIARTEMLSTTNAAHLEVMQNAGARNKEWLATRDDRVRDSHAAADGQVVPIEEPFRIGSALLDAPGVGRGGGVGPPEETINCRCVVLPVIGEKLYPLIDELETITLNGKH